VDPSTTDQVKQVAEQAVPALKEVAAQLLSYLNQAAGFAQEQMPLLARDIIRFGVWEHGLFTLLGFLLVLTSVVLVFDWNKNYRLYKLGASDSRSPRAVDVYHENRAILDMFVAAISGVVGVILFLANAMGFVQALVAPRMYLIEYLTHLVTGK